MACNQLQKITDCLANVPQPVPFSKMPKEEIKRVGDLVASCFLDKPSMKDEQECQILKILYTELNDLLEMHSGHEIQSMEACRNRMTLLAGYAQQLVDSQGLQ